MRDVITPLIITYDEAPNIRRTLEKLRWARRIVIVDSGSTDGTAEIAREFAQVEVLEHSFVDAASQCNYGLERITSPWVLSLDADYELSDQLVSELEILVPADDVAGYRADFVYRIHGRDLRGTLYPARTVLYRTAKAAYRQEGHTQRVTIDGEISSLRGVIYHDDRKPLTRWLTSQQRYAREEAKYLLGADRERLRRIDKIRLLGWPAPIAVPFYTLFVKGCFLDGWAGWFYVMQRILAEVLLALEIMEHRLSSGTPADTRLPNDRQ